MKYEGDLLCEKFSIVNLKMEETTWQGIWAAPGAEIGSCRWPAWLKNLSPKEHEKLNFANDKNNLRSAYFFRDSRQIIWQTL